VLGGNLDEDVELAEVARGEMIDEASEVNVNAKVHRSKRVNCNFLIWFILVFDSLSIYRQYLKHLE